MSNNKTHCLNGHPFDEENTYLYKGHRHCRKCRAERQRPVNEANKKPALVTVRAPEGMKYCGECRQMKGLDEFPNDQRRRDGRFPYCLGCSTTRVRLITAQHMTTADGRQMMRVRAQVQRLKLYGMTLVDYERLHARQNGVCAICHEPETSSPTGKYKDRPRVLSVDHDHETGQVRGLLCHRCNVVLGLSDDDPDRLEAAARYLRSG